MKYLALLVLFSVVTVIYGGQPSFLESCDHNVQQLCSATDIGNGAIVKCNSITGAGWDKSEKKLQTYAKTILKRSYELLGLAVNHGSFSRNRPGFEKLFQKLSDDSFEDAIKIFKYITERGGAVKFNEMENIIPANKFHKSEFESLSVAQTIERDLLEDAHRFVLDFENERHTDPNTLHFIEEEFIKPKTSVVRKLTGYVHDMDKLLRTEGNSFNIFEFDAYLDK